MSWAERQDHKGVEVYELVNVSDSEVISLNRAYTCSPEEAGV